MNIIIIKSTCSERDLKIVASYNDSIRLLSILESSPIVTEYKVLHSDMEDLATPNVYGLDTKNFPKWKMKFNY